MLNHAIHVADGFLILSSLAVLLVLWHGRRRRPDLFRASLIAVIAVLVGAVGAGPVLDYGVDHLGFPEAARALARLALALLLATAASVLRELTRLPAALASPPAGDEPNPPDARSDEPTAGFRAVRVALSAARAREGCRRWTAAVWDAPLIMTLVRSDGTVAGEIGGGLRLAGREARTGEKLSAEEIARLRIADGRAGRVLFELFVTGHAYQVTAQPWYDPLGRVQGTLLVAVDATPGAVLHYEDPSEET